jgi:hypothetical protein
MKKILSSFILITTVSFALAQDSAPRLIYADFEQLDKDKRPISARGGRVIFGATAQNSSNKPSVAPKMFGPQPPLSQRIAFEFETKKPNDWATAYMKIFGFKDKGYTAGAEWERKILAKAEDLSGYQFLALEIGAAGINQVRIELISESNGIDTNAYPGVHLNINNQLQPYRIPISDFKQPEGDWVRRKTTAQEVIKKLTAVQINVFSVPAKGLVVVDNLAFVK